MRNGILLAAIAALFAVSAPIAHADPLLTIAPPAATGGQLFGVPYVLSPAAEAELLSLELQPCTWWRAATSRVTFTPAAAGDRRDTVLVDANSAKKEGVHAR